MENTRRNQRRVMLMKKIVTPLFLAVSLVISAAATSAPVTSSPATSTPVLAESGWSRFLSGDVLSGALSVAAETLLNSVEKVTRDSGLVDSGWFNQQQPDKQTPDTQNNNTQANDAPVEESLRANNAESASIETESSNDPLEKYNRMMFAFNSRLDDLALRPLAESYSEYTPSIVQTGVRNFFSNIGDVGVLTNSVLQGKLDQALEDTSRLAINSVIGLGGVIDVASALDIEKNNEDFGQTLGFWGVPEGPYIVLPLLGPRTVRSAVGTALDTYLQVETLGSVTELAGAESVVSELLALNLINQRTRLLGKESLLEKAALDPYLYAREAYLAYRRCKVNNCDNIDYVPAAPESGNDSPSSTDNELDELDELEMLDELDEFELDEFEPDDQ